MPITNPVSRGDAVVAALSSVASSASSVELLPTANPGRAGFVIFNDSSAILYVAFAGTASTTAFTDKIAAGAVYNPPQPVYTGVVSGIWASANGYARVTELT